MRCSAILGLLAAALWSCPAVAAEVDWKTRLAFDLRYDDNILELSDSDIDRLDDPRPNDARRNRFSIESADDFVAIPEVAPELRVDWLRGAPTTFSVDLTAYQYRSNDIKSYQSYRLAVDQALHRDRKHATVLTLTGGVIPRYYLRNLVDDEASLATGIAGLREEATYRKTMAEAQVEQGLVPDRLRLTLAYGNEERDYNADFDERDSSMPYGEALLTWGAVRGGHLRLRIGYRHEDLQATGEDPDTPFTEADISSERDIWAAEARTRWGAKGHRKTLRLGFIAEKRDFTTDEPLDIFHFDRTDRRRYTSLDFQANLRKGWFFTTGVQHETNDTEFPTTPGSPFEPDDITDYTQNLIQFGFGYEFGGGRREPKVTKPDREEP